MFASGHKMAAPSSGLTSALQMDRRKNGGMVKGKRGVPGKKPSGNSSRNVCLFFGQN